MASVNGNQLSAGQKAPNFTATDVSGKKLTLNKLDDRYILVVFFRYAGCPWCNLAIHRLSLEYATLQQNDCEVIAFVQSDKSAVVDNIYERHAVRPEFPIIADHTGKYYDLYKVQSSFKAVIPTITKIPAWLHAIRKHGFKQTEIDGNLLLVPASFLIDGRTHKILKTHYGSSFYDTETFIDIYQSVLFKEL